MKPPKPLERDIQAAIVRLMELDGWDAMRTDPVSDRERGTGFGEPGQTDYLFLRYQPDQVLYVEFKAPGKYPKQHQIAWMAAKRARGARVTWTDSVEKFSAWYLREGLARHHPDIFIVYAPPSPCVPA